MGSGTSAPKAPPSASDAAILRIGELLHDAEDLFAKGPEHRAEAMTLVAAAHGQLSHVAPEQADTYATMVYAREGKLHYAAGDMQRAAHAYSVVIQRVELRVVEKCRGLYLLLQRYTECTADYAKIIEGQADAASDPLVRAAKLRECEERLLRCIDLVEEGHNRRSDMLVLPLTRLAALYERLGHHKKAELLLRRCQGVIIVQFGYDHADLEKIDAKLAKLSAAGTNADAAVKIQSVVRMFLLRKRLAATLGRPMFRRHELLPPALVGERDKGAFLAQISNVLQPGTAMGHQVVGEVS